MSHHVRRQQVACPAALVALLVLLAGCGSSEDDAGAAVEPDSPDASTATSSSSPQTPLLPGDNGAITPGTYRFTVVTETGWATPEALVTVPDGFMSADETGGWYVVSPDGDTYLGLWTVGLVDRDACRHEERDAVSVGPSVDDLAAALVAQRSTRADAPAKTTVGGDPADYVELMSPKDLSSCGKYPALWRQPERPIYNGGQVDRVWIVDVDGRRIVVNGAYTPKSTRTERGALTSMVDSLRFVAAQ